LEGKTPIEWLREGRDRERLLALAREASERFGRWRPPRVGRVVLGKLPLWRCLTLDTRLAIR